MRSQQHGGGTGARKAKVYRSNWNPEPAGLWERGREEVRRGSALRRYTQVTTRGGGAELSQVGPDSPVRP